MGRQGRASGLAGFAVNWATSPRKQFARLTQLLGIEQTAHRPKGLEPAAAQSLEPVYKRPVRRECNFSVKQ